MTKITLNQIHHQYGGTAVLHDINYEFESGRFYTILGPSGCGKTTILKMIGGFIHPTEGTVEFDSTVVNGIDANKRKVNTVFQDYALFPHLNVFENVAFGLKVKRLGKDIIEKKVDQALSMVNLLDLKNRDISALSGGQKQRIAIARAIVNEPNILLLDEPLSALDHKLRVDMQYELKEIQRALGITFIFVTHDQEEALALSDEILVMSEGRIVQAGPPKDIYDEPLNEYVADFIGESNIIKGTMIKDYIVNIYGKNYECVDGGIAPNTEVDVVIRPEDIFLTEFNAGKINARVDSVLFRGVHYEIALIDEDGYEWIIHSTKKAIIDTQVGMDFNPEDIHIMLPGETEKEFKARMKQFIGEQ